MSSQLIELGNERLELHPPVLIDIKRIQPAEIVLKSMNRSIMSTDTQRTIAAFETRLHEFVVDGKINMDDITVAADDIVGPYAFKKLRARDAWMPNDEIDEYIEQFEPQERKDARLPESNRAYIDLIEVCAYLDRRFPISEEDTVVPKEDGQFWIDRYQAMYGYDPKATAVDRIVDGSQVTGSDEVADEQATFSEEPTEAFGPNYLRTLFRDGTQAAVFAGVFLGPLHAERPGAVVIASAGIALKGVARNLILERRNSQA